MWLGTERKKQNARGEWLLRGRFELQQVDDSVGQSLFAEHDAHVAR
ncbi:hypothetical protein CA13_17990 [Planctomycetes bacterium CA13]|uniref:Uncharacterized protein n=1 Tax=Novipirellula herctigrandis TaxID=2527986 RepID=A0A5C5YZB7_9BACT|nr:hypothetical protein CA13_17990 [Planctomycetes bacterium CA13]